MARSFMRQVTYNVQKNSSCLDNSIEETINNNSLQASPRRLASLRDVKPPRFPEAFGKPTRCATFGQIARGEPEAVFQPNLHQSRTQACLRRRLLKRWRFMPRLASTSLPKSNPSQVGASQSSSSAVESFSAIFIFKTFQFRSSSSQK